MRRTNDVTRRSSRVHLAALAFAWCGVLLFLTGSDHDRRGAPRGQGPGDHDEAGAAPSPVLPAPRHRASPLTLSLLAVLALLLWINAAVNSYRFNVAIAALGSIPLVLAVIRARSLRT